MNTDKFSFRRFWLVLRWRFLSEWNILAFLVITSFLVIIATVLIAKFFLYEPSDKEGFADYISGFPAGILMGVCAMAGVLFSDFLRKKDKRREILMLPALPSEKALGSLLFYIPTFPVMVFLGLKAGLKVFKLIMYRLPDSLYVDFDACAAVEPYMTFGMLAVVSMILLICTSTLLGAMLFRKVYGLFAILVLLVESLIAPVIAVVFDFQLSESMPATYSLIFSVCIFWTVVNLWMAYKIFLNTDIAEHGLMRKV